MTLRRITILVHGLLVVALVAAAAPVAMVAALSLVPDRGDPDEWAALAAIILVPAALAILASAGVVALGVRSWMRSGNRIALVIGDLVAAFTLAVVGIMVPAPLGLVALGALVVAGATVAANRPAPADRGVRQSVRRSPGAIMVVIVAAVVVGAVFVAPFLLTMLTFV